METITTIEHWSNQSWRNLKKQLKTTVKLWKIFQTRTTSIKRNSIRVYVSEDLEDWNTQLMN